MQLWNKLRRTNKKLDLFRNDVVNLLNVFSTKINFKKNSTTILYKINEKGKLENIETRQSKIKLDTQYKHDGNIVWKYDAIVYKLIKYDKAKAANQIFRFYNDMRKSNQMQLKCLKAKFTCSLQ